MRAPRPDRQLLLGCAIRHGARMVAEHSAVELKPAAGRHGEVGEGGLGGRRAVRDRKRRAGRAFLFLSLSAGSTLPFRPGGAPGGSIGITRAGAA